MGCQETVTSRIEGLPRIALRVEPQIVNAGQKASISWRVDDAEEVLLWQSCIAVEVPNPINWSEIQRVAEPVDAAGERTIEVNEATAFYLIARTAKGMVAQQQTVLTKAEKTVPEMVFRERMLDRSKVRWTARIADVSLSSPEQVIFTDESTELIWFITGTTCASMATRYEETRLAADSSKRSGTRYDGGAIGNVDPAPCSLANGAGSYSVNGTLSWWRNRHQHDFITAESPDGPPITGWHWIDVLGIPTLQGCSPARATEIRNAIRKIDHALRSGGIYNNPELDTEVAAFREGHLNRFEVWYELLAQLQNLNLITFDCVEWTEEANAQWDEFSNTIHLWWKIGGAPLRLPYVILHELSHKVGFNHGLDLYYAFDEIQKQAHQVSRAVFPTT